MAWMTGRSHWSRAVCVACGVVAGILACPANASARALLVADGTPALVLVELSTDSVAARIAMPGPVTAVAVRPFGATGYAAAGNTLVEIDIDARAERRRIVLPGAPIGGLASTRDGRLLALQGDRVTVIDPAGLGVGALDRARRDRPTADGRAIGEPRGRRARRRARRDPRARRTACCSYRARSRRGGCGDRRRRPNVGDGGPRSADDPRGIQSRFQTTHDQASSGHRRRTRVLAARRPAGGWRDGRRDGRRDRQSDPPYGAPAGGRPRPGPRVVEPRRHARVRRQRRRRVSLDRRRGERPQPRCAHAFRRHTRRCRRAARARTAPRHRRARHADRHGRAGPDDRTRRRRLPARWPRPRCHRRRPR